MSDKKYWEEIYYKNLKESEKDFIKDVWMVKYKSIICNVKNKKALDLGCGLGQDSVWLIQNGFDVTSCDFSEKALKKFKEIYPKANIMNFDITNGLPFEDNSLGLVNANLSLHYFDLKKTIEIFDEIYNILEQGGLFIGRMNSDKNDYIDDNFIELEKKFYYDKLNNQHKRLFNQFQFDLLTNKWKVIILKEDETIRKGRKKYTWEFVLQK